MAVATHKSARSLAVQLAESGRRDECLQLIYQEALSDPGVVAWVHGPLSDAMREGDLTLAGEYAAILSALRWGSRWYPPRGFIAELPVQPGPTYLTIGKLRHDIDQFHYLQQRGILGQEFTPIIANYERIVDRLTANGQQGRTPLLDEDRDAIGHVYNRIVHVRESPRVQRALSPEWDRADVERAYLDNPSGIAVIDDFLSREALESLRLFCLESTVWSGNRYAHGRLGAFLRDGFSCPLLLQIAEELRNALPRVIGARYPLRQLWGFKYAPTLPPDSTNHADFAAVNVNLWITPEDANLDDSSGGLIIYDVDAPLGWDFATYNSRGDIIKPFLRDRGARATTIPYRENRAILFNSDLFHATAKVNFRADYMSRRINITALYGDREDDVHHPGHRQDGTGQADLHPAWRSAAFSRARRP